MATAMVFPGMGPARLPELGRFLLLNPVARELVPAADEALGASLFAELRKADPKDTAGGDYSVAAQVAFMVACYGLARWAEDELGEVPTVCTGPSFGQKPLIAFSGALDAGRAVAMTARLARVTEEYFAVEHQGVVTQSFVRAPQDGLRTLLDDMTGRGEWHELSCRVDDGIAMVSLHERHLEAFQKALRSLGSLPLYTMRPPMHSSLFTGLRDRAAKEIIDDLPLRDPRLPVIADQDGREITTAGGLRTLLLDHFVRPVDWPATLDALHARGVTRLVVAGPDALFGRVDRAVTRFDVVAAEPAAALRPKAGPRPGAEA